MQLPGPSHAAHRVSQEAHAPAGERYCPAAHEAVHRPLLRRGRIQSCLHEMQMDGWVWSHT